MRRRGRVSFKQEGFRRSWLGRFDVAVLWYLLAFVRACAIVSRSFIWGLIGFAGFGWSSLWVFGVLLRAQQDSRSGICDS